MHTGETIPFNEEDAEGPELESSAQEVDQNSLTPLNAEEISKQHVEQSRNILLGDEALKPFGIDLAEKLPETEAGSKTLTRVSDHNSKGGTVWDND